MASRSRFSKASSTRVGSGNVSSRRLTAVATAVAGLAGLGAGGPFAPDHPLTKGLPDRDQIALESLAAEPEDLHPAIVTVAMSEDKLVQLPALWTDFDVSVRPLLDGYAESDQAAIQDLLRHPGLVRDLVGARPDDAEGLRTVVARYPQAVRSIAIDAAQDHRELLVGLLERVDRAVKAFEALIASTPPETQQAFRTVVGHADVTSLLIDHIRATERLAGSGRVDRAATVAELAGLGAQVAERKRLAAEEDARRRADEERRRREKEEQQRRGRLYRANAWYPYWGASSCWYGDPYYRTRYRGVGARCWYPWSRYRHRWW